MLKMDKAKRKGVFSRKDIDLHGGFFVLSPRTLNESVSQSTSPCDEHLTTEGTIKKQRRKIDELRLLLTLKNFFISYLTRKHTIFRKAIYV